MRWNSCGSAHLLGIGLLFGASSLGWAQDVAEPAAAAQPSASVALPLASEPSEPQASPLGQEPPAASADGAAESTAAQVAPADNAPSDPAASSASNAPSTSARKPAAKKPSGPPPAQTAYKQVFYDNDFTYLNNPANQDFYLGDMLKQMRPTPRSVLDVGGEYRLRDQHEFNMRNSGPVGSNLTGLSDDFLLQRERFFASYRYEDWFRVYAESLNATESFNRDTPRNIEVNPWDIQNLFVEAKLAEPDQGDLWARGGRQELLYGAQRLISPLEWANTRRTFDGAKGYWKGDKWDIDGFWTRPVLPGQHILNSTGPTTGQITSTLDQPDYGQQFYGTYATYKKLKNHTLDLFYLGYLENKAPNAENGIFKTNFQTNTMGTRFQGNQGNWLYEVEGAYQFGTYGSGLQSAGMLVLGGGYQFSQRRWKPTLWAYYDWASGNSNPGGSTHGTFNQLFPFSHKYLGYMDLVGRQNIRDLNFQLTATPKKKIELQAWYHIFELDQAKDSLYNAQGLAIRTDATGNSGRNVGQEIDLTLAYQFTARTDVLFGYSHFFAGSFVKNTDPVGVSGNADFYYSQWRTRF